MDVDGFIKNFASQLDDTDSSLISAETKFKDLEEWSSFTALMIIAMVDSEYNLKLTGDDIREANTVSDLFNTLSTKSVN